jgi:hypothetical protein
MKDIMTMSPVQIAKWVIIGIGLFQVSVEFRPWFRSLTLGLPILFKGFFSSSDTPTSLDTPSEAACSHQDHS